MFWAYAIVFHSRVRIIDFFGMTGLARLPLLAITLLLVPFASSFAPGTSHRPTPPLMLLGLLALGGLSATLVLLHQGFKNASGLRGKRHGAGFAALVVLLELLSKAILWRLA